MTLTVELPGPAEAWIGCGLAAWYAFAAALIRWGVVPRILRDPFTDPDPHRLALSWVMSPALFPAALAASWMEWFGRVVLGGRRPPHSPSSS